MKPTYFLISLVLLMLMPSCMVTKCRYGNGLKIEIPSLKRNPGTEQFKVTTQKRTAGSLQSKPGDTAKVTSFTKLKKLPVLLNSAFDQNHLISCMTTGKSNSGTKSLKKPDITYAGIENSVKGKENRHLAKAVHFNQSFSTDAGNSASGKDKFRIMFLAVILTILILAAAIFISVFILPALSEALAAVIIIYLSLMIACI
jgi:hypothetical protein